VADHHSSMVSTLRAWLVRRRDRHHTKAHFTRKSPRRGGTHRMQFQRRSGSSRCHNGCKGRAQVARAASCDVEERKPLGGCRAANL